MVDVIQTSRFGGVVLGGRMGGRWNGGENDPMGRPKVGPKPGKVVELRLVL